jgi:phosphoribosylamine--glycine ligase
VTLVMPTRVLVVGAGGREHALAWKLGGEPGVNEVIVAPGSDAIAAEPRVRRAGTVDPLDAAELVALALRAAVELAVIGPEAPLAAGVADALTAAGVPTFGPTAAAARIESSKAFCREVAVAAGVRMARGRSFDALDPARSFARELAAGGGVVVKADGLAAGKGVTVCAGAAEADDALGELFAGDAAGARVVVEERLEGREASLIALCDGRRALALPLARDHKRLADDDRGPNTGGMGAYSPAPVLTADLEAAVMDRIIRPTVATLAAEGTPYIGVLFAGLMLTAEGPKLIEYNCRFGDPECQVLMMRFKGDFAALLHAAASGVLAGAEPPAFSHDYALTVVMAANGYPGTPEKGGAIHRIADAEAGGVRVFHAGTAREDRVIVAAGGRVLNVTATGKSVTEAQARAYIAVDKLDFPSGFCRRDIGWREVAREAE